MTISPLLQRIGAKITGWFGAPRAGKADAVPPGIPAVVPYGGSATLALQLGAVWACCRLISDAVSALPAHIFERTSNGKIKAIDHPYYRLLTMQPNPLMTTQQWIQTTVLHLLLYGNAYTLPEWLDGEVIALWPIQPERVTITPLTDGSYVHRIAYAYGKPVDYTPMEILHFRLFSMDGVMGLSPIDFHRLAFQVDALTRLYSVNLYTNGGRPSGVLEYPGNLTKEQIKDIRDSWRMVYSGAENAGGVVVLEGGTKYAALAMPPEQLQFIDQQKYSVEQIARIFGVPPHLIGALDKPTYASVEQLSLEFVRYRLQPIVTMLERAIAAAMLETPFFFNLNLAAFERSDIRTRYAAYATARQWGWMSVNDIREQEDLDRIGPEGDIYLQPLNMVSAGTEGATNGTGNQVLSADGMQG